MRVPEGILSRYRSPTYFRSSASLTESHLHFSYILRELIESYILVFTARILWIEVEKDSWKIIYGLNLELFECGANQVNMQVEHGGAEKA